MRRIPSRPARTCLRRSCAGLLLAVLMLGGLLAGPSQPAAAQAVSTATPTPTETGTLTLTTTLTATLTETGTPTLTPTTTTTATITPTLTITATPTQTLTATITLTPTPSLKVLINEVAWAGTKATTFGDYGEWIELYNPGTAAIPLSGWTLTASSGSPRINLTGSIPAGGYFLLERLETGTFPLPLDTNHPGPPDLTYSGALSDSGDSLYLRDSSGLLMDTANANGGGWPAGNLTSRCSMERASATAPDTDVNWTTSRANPLPVDKDAAGNWVCGSPRNTNWAYSVTATASPTLTPTRTVTPTRTPTLARSLTPTRTVTPRRTVTGTPNRATPESIVLNEFLPHPRSDWNQDGKIDSGDGFIEVKNLGSQPISLSGWRLDDQEGDSSPYTIRDVILQPGVRIAFFTSQTGLLLSDGGDSVRLFKSTGQIDDAYTYPVVKVLNQSWCRLPDGSPFWQTGCAPSPGEVNHPAESVFVANRLQAPICLSPKLPLAIFSAECAPLGLERWAPELWESLSSKYPWYLELETQEFILE
jgi:hypothetical protein